MDKGKQYVFKRLSVFLPQFYFFKIIFFSQRTSFIPLSISIFDPIAIEENGKIAWKLNESVGPRENKEKKTLLLKKIKLRIKLLGKRFQIFFC